MELPRPGESYINPDHEKRHRKLGNIVLVAVNGITAAGKTTLMDELSKRFPEEYVKVIGYTNRPRRPAEADGVDYHFVTDAQLNTKLLGGELLQLETLPSGDIYGTAFDSYTPDKANLFAVAAQAMPNFRTYGFMRLEPYYVVPDGISEWKKRLQKQNIEPEKMPKRAEEAIQSLEFALQDSETRYILNDVIDDALDRIQQGRRNEKIWDEELARSTAKILLDQLKIGII